MEELRDLDRLYDILLYSAYYMGDPSFTVDGVFSLGKGRYPDGLSVKNQRAVRELEHLRKDVRQVVDRRKSRLVRILTVTGTHINAGASEARVVRGSDE